MKNQQYEKGFKEEALKLSHEIGIRKAAKDLGIPYYTLSGWRRSERRYDGEVSVGSGNKRIEKGKEKETQLEEENRRLKRANGILKEALSFFVEDQKR